MPLCVLPPAEGTPGQVLPPDQGGIALSCADICAQFRLCLHSGRRREQSTSPPENARPLACVLFGVFCASPFPGVDAIQLLLDVAPPDVDARLAPPAVYSVPRAP